MATSGSQSRFDSRRAHREWVLLAAILLLGATLRVIYLQEARQAPDFEAPAVDAAFHDYWARGLATGQWTPRGGAQDPELGEWPYFRPPGYPYFLAGIYTVFGSGYDAPRWIQMGLGLANIVLAWWLGRQSFGRAVGLILGSAMAFYWIFIFFESELQATALFVFLLLAFANLLGAWRERRTIVAAAGAGIAGGLAALVRPNALALVVAATVWMVWIGAHRQDRTGTRKHAFALLLGCALAVLPATVRNYAVAGDFVLISSNAGINLYIGNNESANGLVATEIDDLGAFRTCFDWPDIVDNLERKLGREIDHSAASSYFVEQSSRFVKSHPARFLALTWRKVLLFWGPDEVAHNEEVHYERRFSPLLSKLPGSFSLVLALGLLGLGQVIHDRVRPPAADSRRGPAAQRSWEMSLLVLFFVVAYFLSVLPFFAAARYRVPVLPFVLFFAAIAIYRFAGLLRRSELRAAAISAVAFLVLFGITTRSLAGYEPSVARWHFDRGTDYDRIGDAERALPHYRQAVEADPAFFEARYNLGHKLRERGNVAEAIVHWEEAVRLHPTFAPAHYNLANAYRGRGDLDRSILHLERAVAQRPASVKYHVELGDLLIATGRFEQAREQYQAALSLDPEHVAAMRNLSFILAVHPNVEARDPDRAVRLAERAEVRTAGRSPSVLDALATAYAAAERWDDAVDAAQRAVALARSSGNDSLADSIQARLDSYRKAR